MIISGIQDQTQVVSAVNSGSRVVELGQSEFLSLLIAQLKAQDPLDPMNGTEFTAQLAQFTSLEQLKDINSSLVQMAESQHEVFNAQAVNFIGKTVWASGNSVYLDQDKGCELNFSLGGAAGSVFISIYDSYGRYLTTIEEKNLPPGDQTVVWNGKDASGKALPEGVYSFEISAVDVNNNLVASRTAVSGTVTSLMYQNGMPYLMIGDIAVPIAAVEKVSS